jgi:DNA-binding CsgD family transcriptional regulator
MSFSDGGFLRPNDQVPSRKPKAPTYYWDRQEKEAFDIMWNNGESCRAIAERLNIPYRSVQTHKDRLRHAGQLKPREKFSYVRYRLQTLAAEGKNAQQIADILHRNVKNVKEELRRAGMRGPDVDE